MAKIKRWNGSAWVSAEGNGNSPTGPNAHAEGTNTVASGNSSHSEGRETVSKTDYTHAEGRYTFACEGTPFKIVAFDDVLKTITINEDFENSTEITVGTLLNIHVDEGPFIEDIPVTAKNGYVITLNTTETITSDWTYAIKKDGGTPTHAEGYCTAAIGLWGSHAEGEDTLASGSSSHAEGLKSLAQGDYSHAEGNETTSSGNSSHAEGDTTIASGSSSHAEGNRTVASGSSSHAEGYSTIAGYDNAHAEGGYTLAATTNSHAEGNLSIACHGKVYNITAYNDSQKTITLDSVTGLSPGDYITVRVDGSRPLHDIYIWAINGLIVNLTTTNTITSSWKQVIEKSSTQYPNHAEGYNTLSSGAYAHAEGESTTASGSSSHAEGSLTTAKGDYSHAEGVSTEARSYGCHAEGNMTVAIGNYAHTEGAYTNASGNYSHAQNSGTKADGYSQTVIGEYNIAQGSTSSRANTDHAFIIGNGTSSSSRSNALTVNWQGDVSAAGKIYSNGVDISTKDTINVETLSADKTLVSTDAKYQYLNPNGATRIITLPASGMYAGQSYTIRNNGTNSNTYNLDIRQSGVTLDNIYAGAIKTFVYDGTNWVSAENGSGENDIKKYNVTLGAHSKAYNAGTAIGYTTTAYSYGVAVGNAATGNTYGVALGPYSNGASYGIALGNYAHTNSKYSAVAKGYYSKAERYNEEWKCSDSASTNKYGYGQLNWCGETTTATPTEIFLGGTASNRATLLTMSAFMFKLYVVAYANGSTEGSTWEISGGIRRDGGTNTALIGTVTKTQTSKDAGVTTWDVSATADDVNEALKITVTGEASHTIRWNVTGIISECRF